MLAQTTFANSKIKSHADTYVTDFVVVSHFEPIATYHQCTI